MKAFNVNRTPVDTRGREVKLFAYRDLVAVDGRQVRAVPGRVGVSRLVAMVDNVVSSNVGRVSVGRLEVAPASMEWDNRNPCGALHEAIVDRYRGEAGVIQVSFFEYL